MPETREEYYKRDFWAIENLKYVEPHFRLTKAARIVNRLARRRDWDLLDVGCGPATLARLLNKNIRYHGIDIAIQNPAPNLLEADFLSTPIRFAEKKFDIVVAQGVFEYVGSFQETKFAEIQNLLRDGGTFLASYVNFDHIRRHVYAPYSNAQSFGDFRNRLGRYFRVDRYIPTSYHLHHHEPNRRFMKALQMHANFNVPLLGRMFAVEYFFLCSRK